MVKVEPFWAVPWKPHVAMEISILRARHTHAMNIACIPRNFPQVAWNKNGATQPAPQEKTQREARKQYRKSMWIHEDAELCGANEKVGARHPRLSAAAEDFILKTSEPGNTKSCVGRGTMLGTRTVPILPHVAKYESHVGAGEFRIWACLVSKIHIIDGLRHSGMGERARPDDGQGENWPARWTRLEQSK